MIDKAIEKITKEMMEIGDELAEKIEEHLTEICKTETIAQKLLKEGKSLKGACDTVVNEAQKSAKNNKACLISTEIFRIVEEYFEINPEDKAGGRIDVLDLL